MIASPTIRSPFVFLVSLFRVTTCRLPSCRPLVLTPHCLREQQTGISHHSTAERWGGKERQTSMVTHRECLLVRSPVLSRLSPPFFSRRRRRWMREILKPNFPNGKPEMGKIASGEIKWQKTCRPVLATDPGSWLSEVQHTPSGVYKSLVVAEAETDPRV